MAESETENPTMENQQVLHTFVQPTKEQLELYGSSSKIFDYNNDPRTRLRYKLKAMESHRKPKK